MQLASLGMLKWFGIFHSKKYVLPWYIRTTLIRYRSTAQNRTKPKSIFSILSSKIVVFITFDKIRIQSAVLHLHCADLQRQNVSQKSTETASVNNLFSKSPFSNFTPILSDTKSPQVLPNPVQSDV